MTRSGLASLLIICTVALTAPSYSIAQEAATLEPDQEPRSEFDLESVADLLANMPPENLRREASPAELRARLGDRVRELASAHIATCWNSEGLRRELTATIEFDLDQDGSLNGEPRVTSPRTYRYDRQTRAFVERAITAVRNCSPFSFVRDPELADHYEEWDELEFVFSVRS